jgi:hypothetical protein
MYHPIEFACQEAKGNLAIKTLQYQVDGNIHFCSVKFAPIFPGRTGAGAVGGSSDGGRAAMYAQVSHEASSKESPIWGIR